MLNECFILDQYAELNFKHAISRTQQSAGKHATLQRHIVLTVGRQVYALAPKCLAEKQQLLIKMSLV